LASQGDTAGAKQNATSVTNSLSSSTNPLLQLDAASALEILYRVYYEEGKLSLSREAIERALLIRHEVLGAGHPAVARNFVSLGLIELTEGNVHRAIAMLERAVNIQRRLDVPQLATSLRLLGSTELKAGALDRAEQHILEACQIMEYNRSLVQPLEYVESLKSLGDVLIARGKLEEARDNLEEAIRIAQVADAPELIREKSIGELSIQHAHVLFELGEYEKGRAILEKTHRTLLKNFGPKHELTQDAAHLLSRIPPIPQ